MDFCVPQPPLRGQPTVLCHPGWKHIKGLTKLATGWGGTGLEPSTALWSDVLPLSPLAS